MSNTIALGQPHDPMRVIIWCDIEAEHENGLIEFTVINGAWHGFYSPDGFIIFGDDDKSIERIKAMLLWRGNVPRNIARRTSTAIEWIEHQIAKGNSKCLSARCRSSINVAKRIKPIKTRND